MSSIYLFLLLVLSASAAQAEGTCSAVVPGPPGRDGRDGTAGRDGMPGNPGTCSYSDIQRIKEEIQTELEQSFRLTVYELLQNQTVGNCTQDQLSKNETSAAPSNDCPQDLGEMSSPAESCLQIYTCQPSSPSRQYWIQTEAGENATQIYCNLQTQLNGTQGWARVAYINMTEDGAQCPGSLRTVTENQKTICTQVDSDAAKCTSVNFAVQGKRYSKICGQALGYQKGTTDAFTRGPKDINSDYVTGISITYSSPRKHVWTYAMGTSDDFNHHGLGNCPCALYPGPSPPSFVSDHYYCESGDTGIWDHSTFYSNDPLWDGDGCGAGNNCCSQPGMPWFCRTLPQEVDEDIEMRVCRSEGSSNEKVYLELLEIYIQ